jgi:hypothetical protein
MRADTTIRPEKPPQALIISTGEDVPQGRSLIGRMIALHLKKDELFWPSITECQEQARDGHYAAVMAGYITWLASRLPERKKLMPATYEAFRNRFSRPALHARTPGAVANLAIGWATFLDFAKELDALTETDHATLWAEVWDSLDMVAQAQQAYQDVADPVDRFFRLLEAALTSGRAHIATANGNHPGTEALGWRIRQRDDGRTDWEPKGERMGFLDGDNLFLQPQVAYAVAERLGRETNEPISLSPQTLWKRIHEAGLLKATDEKSESLKVRRVFDGHRQWFLYLDLSVIFPKDGQQRIC